LHDHIQKILPLKQGKHRAFLIVTKRSGIVFVKSYNPHEFKYQQVKQQEMEQLLPFKAGCLPSCSASLISSTPPFLQCMSSLGSHLVVQKKETEHNQAIDERGYNLESQNDLVKCLLLKHMGKV